jgi:hypothetical protein
MNPCGYFHLVAGEWLRQNYTWTDADSVSVHLAKGVLQSNQIAARRLRGLAGGVLGKLCMIHSREKFTLLP